MYIHTLVYEYTLTNRALGIDKRWEFVIDVPAHMVSVDLGASGAD